MRGIATVLLVSCLTPCALAGTATFIVVDGRGQRVDGAAVAVYESNGSKAKSSGVTDKNGEWSCDLDETVAEYVVTAYGDQGRSRGRERIKKKTTWTEKYTIHLRNERADVPEIGCEYVVTTHSVNAPRLVPRFIGYIYDYGQCMPAWEWVPETPTVQCPCSCSPQ